MRRPRHGRQPDRGKNRCPNRQAAARPHKEIANSSLALPRWPAALAKSTPDGRCSIDNNGQARGEFQSRFLRGINQCRYTIAKTWNVARVLYLAFLGRAGHRVEYSDRARFHLRAITGHVSPPSASARTRRARGNARHDHAASHADAVHSSIGVRDAPKIATFASYVSFLG